MPSPSLPNRREFTRVPVELPLYLELESNRCVEVRLLDLSVAGACFSPSAELTDGMGCRFEIRIGPRGEQASMCGEGRIVRTTGQDTSVAFTHMRPESLALLRAFVLLHAEDAELIAREFEEHAVVLGGAGPRSGYPW